MGLFGFRKGKPLIQQAFDDFFGDMEIVDVIGASDIPIVRINGNAERRMPGDMFFHDYARLPPHRIDSFTKDIDTIFWIFDTFCVFELNASDDRAKQFMVLQRVSKKD